MQYAWFYNLLKANIDILSLNHNLFKKKEYFFTKLPHETCRCVHSFAHNRLICAVLMVYFKVFSSCRICSFF